jgi:hypothetical protein
MSLPDKVDEARARQLRIQEQAEAFFEPQLAPLGLSVAAIESQDLIQLRASLAEIDKLIQNPGQLPTFRTSTSALSVWVVKAEGSVEIGVLPILLQRRRRILERIAELGGPVHASTLRDLIGEVRDEAIQTRLRKEIDDLEQQAMILKQGVAAQEAAERAAHLEEIRIEGIIRQGQLDIERAEHRARVWRRFLERESVATILGGFLLLCLTASLVVAMFLGTTVPEIFSNGFFIILGYFFGQTAGRATARADE